MFWTFPALLFLLVACSPPPAPAVSQSSTPTQRLTVYQSPTPPPNIEATEAAPAATRTLQPSPTPFTYTIIENDTLLTIAFRFGVTVDEIMAANPGVDPRILSIGTTLVIPLAGAGEAVIPTATPVPLLVGPTRCYESVDAGVWCFIPVLNESPVGIAGVIGEVSVYTPAGELFASLPVSPPVDIIPPGKSLPLYGNLSVSIPQGYFVRGRVTGAFLAEGGEERRLFVGVVESKVELLDGGRAAVAQGLIELAGVQEEEAVNEGTLRVAAVAYNSGNEVVGLRLWEESVEGEPGGRYPFEIQVYSLGPPIAKVEMFAEGRVNLPSE